MRADQMVLFVWTMDIRSRPPFRIVRNRDWGQCTNNTDDYLVVYGPKNWTCFLDEGEPLPHNQNARAATRGELLAVGTPLAAPGISVPLPESSDGRHRSTTVLQAGCSVGSTSNTHAHRR